MIRAERLALAKAVPIERVIDERGIKLRGKVERTGPCPVCGGTDRFAINVRKQIFICRGCAAGGDVIALVQHLDRANFQEAVEILAGHRKQNHPQHRHEKSRRNGQDEAEKYEGAQHRKAAALWQRRERTTGVVETYLRSRGYRGLIPPTLGYLQPRKPEHRPAMIAAFGMTAESEPGVLASPDNVNAVHLTLLKPDGSGKADIEPKKLIIGRPLGRPIVLAAPNDLLGLAVTEGIEDALTVHAATGLCVWAAGCAGLMPSLAAAVPKWIESVTIFAHDDPAGQRGARPLADALLARGIDVFVEGLA